MNLLMTANRQARRVAGLTAVVATLFTMGGTLGLAEHYATASPGEQEYLVHSDASSQTLAVANRNGESV